MYITRSNARRAASVSDFKDVTVPQFGHSDVVFCSICSKERQKVSPVNHQQKRLLNGICGTFDIKSNYFGPVIPKKLKKFGKIGY